MWAPSALVSEKAATGYCGKYKTHQCFQGSGQNAYFCATFVSFFPCLDHSGQDCGPPQQFTEILLFLSALGHVIYPMSLFLSFPRAHQSQLSHCPLSDSLAFRLPSALICESLLCQGSPLVGWSQDTWHWAGVARLDPEHNRFIATVLGFHPQGVRSPTKMSHS